MRAPAFVCVIAPTLYVWVRLGIYAFPTVIPYQVEHEVLRVYVCHLLDMYAYQCVCVCISVYVYAAAYT